MTAGIGTVSEIVDGVYTGELAGPFCYGRGKVEAITDLARWEGPTSPSATRTATRPATCRCSRPSVILSPSTPTPSSSASPTHNGWPIVVFSKRTKAVVRRTTQALGTAGVAAAGFAAGTRYATRDAKGRVFGIRR